jgi:uncharacterized Zn finger protein
MGWFTWKRYVPAAKRREEARRKTEKLKKQGTSISPVTIEGRTIARSFWGKSWCENLERYSDYENRLPRGRSYIRNGSVIDLQVKRGEVIAMVSGSEIYNIRVKITPVADEHWTAICGDCAGSIGSLVELLQGRLSKSVMERVCRKGDGLFPAPHEIKLSCSCPDWADMCKHVAAVMYGIGARLDEKPELLFTLRAVDENELIANAGKNVPVAGAMPTTARVIVDDDISALFGIDVGDENAVADTKQAASRPSVRKEERTGVKKRAQSGTNQTPATSKTVRNRRPTRVKKRRTKTKSRKLRNLKKSLAH